MSFEDSKIAMPWLAGYPDYLPKEIEHYGHPNLGAFVDEMCQKYGDLPAYTNFATTRSFTQIHQRARAMAAYLQQELGYQKGDRLAIMMPNLMQYPVCLYACFMAGIVAVNINPLYTARELKHQLADADVKGIVIAENFAHTFAQVQADLPDVKDIIITSIGDELGTFKGMAVNFVVRYIKKLVQPHHFIHSLTYKQCLSKGRQLSLQAVDVTREDIAVLQYTGGTTGVAKGAVLTHKNLLANVKQVELWVKEAIDRPGLVCVTPLPLYHIFSCTVNSLCFPGLGMHNVLITNPRDMKAFIRTIKRHPFSVMTGLNTLFKGLLHAPGFRELDFSELRFVVSGGMPLEKVVADKWQEVTGNVIIEGYGLTETSPIVTINWLKNDTYTNGIGYPVPSTQVMLCDDNGQPVAVGEAGEMWVKGPQVMQGYWQQPQETANCLRDGWFKTGDMAVMNDKGFFRIVDRKKDMVLVSGFNVYPTEVEAVLVSHPDVLEVAVIGVPNENSGEVVKAFIVCKQGRSVSEDTLRAFAKENLTGYKRPKIYEFREELPKSPVGKLLRRELMREEREKLTGK